MKILAFFEISLLLSVIVVICSCKKDPGNHNYHDVSKAYVTQLDSMYIVFKGEKLTIRPNITYNNDINPDTVNYSYHWLLLGPVGLEAFKPKIMGEGTVFNGLLPNGLGLYNATFRITDKRSGVWTERPFKLLILNEIYEGWFLLSEVPGSKSRLDMLSYAPADGKYTMITDAPALMKSKVQLEGRPNFVKFIYPAYYFGIDFDKSAQGRLAIGTEKMAATLGTNTLAYQPLADLNEIMPSGTLNVPNVSIQSSANYCAVISASNNVYYADESHRTLKQFNLRIGMSEAFHASPHVGFWDAKSVIFDEDQSEFLWSSLGSQCVKLDNGEDLFKNKIDKNLLFLKYSRYSGGELFAVLQDKIGAKTYIARFSLTKQIYFGEIQGTQIGAASHIEISDNYSYLFYNVGGKVYEYDFVSKINKEMADYGSLEVSLIKFEPSNYNFSPNPRYAAIFSQLMICTYDKNNLDNSGTMDLYSVPPRNEQLLKNSSYTGFGKIVSATYRFR